MNDRELQDLLRAEGERLDPGPMPDLVGKGRAARRRRIAGVSAVAAFLVGGAGFVSAQAQSTDDRGAVSVADSRTASDQTSAPPPVVDGCPGRMMSTTSLEPGWLETDGYWSLTALGMSLDPWLLGGQAVSAVEVLEETREKARLLLLVGVDDEEQAAVVHADPTDRGWVASVIEQCQ